MGLLANRAFAITRPTRRRIVWAAVAALTVASPALAQTADALWREASKYYEMSQSGAASTNPVARAALLEKAVAAALKAQAMPDGANPDFISSRRDIQIALADAYLADRQWDRAAQVYIAVKRDFPAPPSGRQDAINYAHAVEGGFRAAIGARNVPAMSASVGEIDRLIQGRPRTDVYMTYLASGVGKLLDHPDFNVSGTSQTPATLAAAAGDSDHALSIVRAFAAAEPGDTARQNRLLHWLFRNGTLRNDVPTLNEASDLAERLFASRRLSPDLTLVRNALLARCAARRTGGQCNAEAARH